MSFFKELEHLRIPFKDIEAATNNFRTIIGQGGYGPVYRGELRISGNLTHVAVKRQQDIDQSGQGLKQFLTEINLLSRNQHPNLVSLLGFCQEGLENILIYEYAEHGSFDKYLINKTNRLTWRQRLNICVEAARGLDYLHNLVGPDHRIIHRDIKSSNILLDGHFKAKIADFGLSKIGRANVNDTFVITIVGGTLGYVDPVYMKTGILTKKSDIYSFGVVLLEALCGRLCFMDVIGERRQLVPLARRCYREGTLSEILDLDLKGSESVKEFSEIAYQCLQKSQKARPSIDVVLKKLENALELLDTYELQEFVEASVLQEILEAMEWQNTLVAQELQETYELQEFVEELVLKKVLEAMELQASLNLSCGFQEYVEALVLQEFLEATEAMELLMDYGTIKAIHMISNTRRPDYTTIEEIYTKLSSGVLLDDRKVWLSLDENGKNQEMISAMKFMPSTLLCENWYVGDHKECEFPKVAKISKASKVNVEVKIIPQFLSSNVKYAAYLVCKHGSANHENFNGLKYKLNNQSQSYYSCPTYIYEHDWVMIELFQTNSLERDVDFKVLLEEFKYMASKDDVIIQGIVFLPIQKFDDEKIQTGDMENPPACETECEKLLPGDYKQFIYYGCHSYRAMPGDYKEFIYRAMEKYSQNHVTRETREQAYAILSRGVHIKLEDDVNAWFWITKSNGKKCFMLSSSSIGTYAKYKPSSPNESRFKRVMEIQSQPHMLSSVSADMSFDITSSLLSTDTSYACYLVYKTLSDSVNLADVKAFRFVLSPTERPWHGEYSHHNGRLHLGGSQKNPVVIGPDGDVAEGEGTPGTIINKPLIRESPRKREDGWLEVRLWNFTTYHNSSIHKNYPHGCSDSMSRFHIFHTGYDHYIGIGFIFKNHNHELIHSPSLTVQGLEFRPL